MPRPVRLVLLLQDLAFGGTQRQAVALAARLDRSRFAPECWMLMAGRDFAPAAAEAGVPLRWLAEGPRVGPASLYGLWRALGAARPDVLVLFTAVPNIWGRVLGRARHVPAVIATCRGGGSIVRQHERLLKNWAAHHIVNAGPLRERLLALGRAASRITVIPNGVDTDHFAPPSDEARPVREVVLCPARFCEDKDHETLLRAFAVTAAKRPRAELWLLGNGPLRDRVRLLAARHPARDRIKLYPSVPDPRPFFEQASLVVLSSVREALPNVLLEAMAMGLPVVATAVGGIPDLVETDRTGLLCAPGDAKTLGEHLAALLADAPRRERFGRNARQRAVDGFSMTMMVRRHEAVFEQVLEETAAAGGPAARCP